MISEQYKFAFVHIPKCGGTSVEKLFTDEFIKAPHVFGTVYKKDRPELYRWTTIRNSWDRIVSCYFYGIKRVGIDISFEEFVMEYIDDKGSKYAYTDENRFFGRDGHLIYVLDHNTKKPCINFYVNLWNIKNHLTKLFKNLKIDLNILDKLEKHNPTNHDDYRSYYKNVKMINAVRKRYRGEIELFGFKFKNPKIFNNELVGKDLNIN